MCPLGGPGERSLGRGTASEPAAGGTLRSRLDLAWPKGVPNEKLFRNGWLLKGMVRCKCCPPPLTLTTDLEPANIGVNTIAPGIAKGITFWKLRFKLNNVSGVVVK